MAHPQPKALEDRTVTDEVDRLKKRIAELEDALRLDEQVKKGLLEAPSTAYAFLAAEQLQLWRREIIAECCEVVRSRIDRFTGGDSQVGYANEVLQRIVQKLEGVQ